MDEISRVFCFWTPICNSRDENEKERSGRKEAIGGEHCFGGKLLPCRYLAAADCLGAQLREREREKLCRNLFSSTGHFEFQLFMHAILVCTCMFVGMYACSSNSTTPGLTWVERGELKKLRSEMQNNVIVPCL